MSAGLALYKASGSKRCKRILGPPVTIEELKKIERYLQRLFGNASIIVKARPRKDDSAEVYVGEEFVGVIYRDDEDDELSYNFSMAILDYDLGK